MLLDQDFHDSQCSDDGGRDDEHGETYLPHRCTFWGMIARLGRRSTYVAEVGGASQFCYQPCAGNCDCPEFQVQTLDFRANLCYNTCARATTEPHA